MNKIIGIFVLGALGTISGYAGTVTGVTTVGDLNPNDKVNWGQLGPNNTYVNSPLSVSSAGGLAFAVTDPGNFIRKDQGTGWNGNFNNGDQLIFGAGYQNSITVVSLSHPISGAGAQIMPDYYGTFTATISAYNGDTLLGTFSEAGVGNFDQDGGAIFIGLFDTDAEITSIAFSVENVDGGSGFAIDTLYMNTTGTATPEPASLFLGAPALLGLGLLARRRKGIVV